MPPLSYFFIAIFSPSETFELPQEKSRLGHLQESSQFHPPKKKNNTWVGAPPPYRNGLVRLFAGFPALPGRPATSRRRVRLGIWVASFGGALHAPVTTYFQVEVGASTAPLTRDAAEPSRDMPEKAVGEDLQEWGGRFFFFFFFWGG